MHAHNTHTHTHAAVAHVRLTSDSVWQLDVDSLIWRMIDLAYWRRRIGVDRLSWRRQIVFYFLETIPQNSEAIVDVSQNWNRLPTTTDGALPCITGGSCMVRIWRKDSGPDFQRILPVELLAVQGASFCTYRLISDSIASQTDTQNH